MPCFLFVDLICVCWCIQRARRQAFDEMSLAVVMAVIDWNNKCSGGRQLIQVLPVIEACEYCMEKWPSERHHWSRRRYWAAN